MRFLHTMIRVKNLEESVKFYELLGLKQTYHQDFPEGRFTLVFMAAPDDLDSVSKTDAPCIELTYNWDGQSYEGGRNFGHLAYQVEDIYDLCKVLSNAGITVNRPPRDGRMAFIRSPDGISIELLQKGKPLTPSEPWASAENIGEW